MDIFDLSYFCTFDAVLAELGQENSLNDILFPRTKEGCIRREKIKNVFVELISKILDNGVWLSVLYKKNQKQTAYIHVINEKYKDYAPNDAFFSSWVLSNSFFAHGYIEPLDQLLFTNATNRFPLVIGRDGKCWLYDERTQKTESQNLIPETLKDVFALGEGNRQSKIDVIVEKCRNGFISELSPKTNPQKFGHDDYERLSLAIDKVIEESFNTKIHENLSETEKIVNDIFQKVRSENNRPSQDELKNVAKGLIESLVWNRLLDIGQSGKTPEKLRWNRILYIPEALTHGHDASGLIVAINENDDERIEKILQILKIICNRIFAALYFRSYLDDAQSAQTKSAVGSIMSRNGSHNIGSHVLSALTHNIGTMPEDRKMYQYIQHRMDYIATATTAFPSWRQPVHLVGCVLKTFMSQTHLLDYISRSEGLCAYRFHGQSGQPNGQKNTIRIHIRRMKNCEDDILKDVEWNFVNYLEECGGYDATKDVLVAIPGGVVGHHALFTILENIIRNAAKHEWSKWLNGVGHGKDGNLDIYVDFRDNPKNSCAEVQIWNSRLVTDGLVSDIVTDLNGKMGQGLISPETHALRMVNWGLAEMRISAGYLNNATMEQIGGDASTLEQSKGLIRAVAVEDGDGKVCLGFRFDLPKPNELLIVLPPKRTIDSDLLAKINGCLCLYGICVKDASEITKASTLPYAFVLLENINAVFSTSDERQWPRLPFRVLSEQPLRDELRLNKNISHIPVFNSYAEMVKKLEEWSDGTDAGRFASWILEQVYAVWISHLNQERGLTHAINLLVDPYPESGSAGRSLVTNADLLHYVFENSFNAAVRSYLKTIATSDETCSVEFAGGLYLLAMMPKKGTLSIHELKECDATPKMVLKQLIAWTNALYEDEACRVTPSYFNLNAVDSEGNPYVSDTWKPMIKECCDSDSRTDNGYFAWALLNELYAEDDAVDQFVEYLVGVVLEQARSFLSRYDEDIPTLPASYQMNPAGKEGTSGGGKQKSEKPIPAISGKEGLVVSLLVTQCRSQAIGYAQTGINYWRHGEGEDLMGQENSANRIFLEPISGSQSYFNSIAALADENELLRTNGSTRLPVQSKIVRMVESGLMRVAIVDERVKKFADEHTEVSNVFKSVGISVFDDRNDVLNIAQHEIVIVHQGVIDKLVPDHTLVSVRNFLNKLKMRYRYIVVTTGRGMPANIPEEMHVLPFSVIESTLFKRYPEKMLLVDNVMNLLTKGEQQT